MTLNTNQFHQWYHGTTHENAESITATGLRATHYGNYTLHKNKEAAIEYAEMDRGYSPSQRIGVVAVQIPARIESGYLETKGHPEAPDEADDGSGNRAWLRRTIPPKYLRRTV